MLEYRVTKYDPSLRDATGAYLHDDWTSVGDIGGSFNGQVFTREQYEKTEAGYVATALQFLEESRQSQLSVSGLEDHAGRALGIGEGTLVGTATIGNLLRRVLREEFWCRLEGPDGFVHVGWDFYLYIGVMRICPEAEALAKRLGLFVEEFDSPYRDRETGA